MKKIAPILIALITMIAITGSVYGQDSHEPNDALGDATAITFNKTVIGDIFPAGDVDDYKFHVNSSGILQVKIEGVPGDMRTSIELYGKNFNWIRTKDASNAGDKITLEIDITQPGWYYIKIRDLAGIAHNEKYSFKVLFEPVVDTKEPESGLGDATEIQFNQTVSGYIFPSGDLDHYKVYVTSSGILQVKIEGVPGDMRTSVSTI